MKLSSHLLFLLHFLNGPKKHIQSHLIRPDLSPLQMICFRNKLGPPFHWKIVAKKCHLC